jgi:hypothetical protein
MPATLDMLKPSYLQIHPLPPAISTPIADANYDGCWAVSEPFWEVVEDDRLAANPINRVDPEGTRLWDPRQISPIVPDNSVLDIVPTEVFGSAENGKDPIPAVWIRGDRGWVQTRVKYIITKPHQNGWIIQHVINKFKFDVIAPGVIPQPAEYWEAWKVIDSQVFVVLPGNHLEPQISDMFSLPDQPRGTAGTMEKTGWVQFIPNYDCRWGNESAAAGSLPSVEHLPRWSDSLGKRHYLKVKWDSTARPPERTKIIDIDPLPTIRHYDTPPTRLP